jgi:hypothetical protein
LGGVRAKAPTLCKWIGTNVVLSDETRPLLKRACLQSWRRHVPDRCHPQLLAVQRRQTWQDRLLTSHHRGPPHARGRKLQLTGGVGKGLGVVLCINTGDGMYPLPWYLIGMIGRITTPYLPPGLVHQSGEPTPQGVLRMWPYWYWYKYLPAYLTVQSQPSNAYLAFHSTQISSSKCVIM